MDCNKHVDQAPICSEDYPKKGELRCMSTVFLLSPSPCKVSLNSCPPPPCKASSSGTFTMRFLWTTRGPYGGCQSDLELVGWMHLNSKQLLPTPEPGVHCIPMLTLDNRQATAPRLLLHQLPQNIKLLPDTSYRASLTKEA